MARYQRHIFVCINERPEGHPKGCCLDKGSSEVRSAFKVELKKRGLTALVRTNNAGCLDACEYGVTLVVYPEGIWYGGVAKEDVPEIIDRTILRGEVIQRLLINDARYKSDALQYRALDIPPTDLL